MRFNRFKYRNILVQEDVIMDWNNFQNILYQSSIFSITAEFLTEFGHLPAPDDGTLRTMFYDKHQYVLSTFKSHKYYILNPEWRKLFYELAHDQKEHFGDFLESNLRLLFQWAPLRLIELTHALTRSPLTFDATLNLDDEIIQKQISFETGFPESYICKWELNLSKELLRSNVIQQIMQMNKIYKVPNRDLILSFDYECFSLPNTTLFIITTDLRVENRVFFYILHLKRDAQEKFSVLDYFTFLNQINEILTQFAPTIKFNPVERKQVVNFIAALPNIAIPEDFIKDLLIPILNVPSFPIFDEEAWGKSLLLEKSRIFRVLMKYNKFLMSRDFRERLARFFDFFKFGPKVGNFDQGTFKIAIQGLFSTTFGNNPIWWNEFSELSSIEINQLKDILDWNPETICIKTKELLSHRQTFRDFSSLIDLRVDLENILPEYEYLMVERDFHQSHVEISERKTNKEFPVNLGDLSLTWKVYPRYPSGHNRIGLQLTSISGKISPPESMERKLMKRVLEDIFLHYDLLNDETNWPTPLGTLISLEEVKALRNRVKIPEKVIVYIVAKCADQCCVCYSRGIQIHHLDGNPANNELDNLAPLCPNCHEQASAHPISVVNLTPSRLKKLRDTWYDICERKRGAPAYGDTT